MPIVRYDPFRQLMRLQDRLNRVFDESLVKYDENDFGSSSWAPATDILETENDLVLKAELPGINPDEVDIRIENNTLTLQGTRKLESDTDKENYHRRERVFGSFLRVFTLPSTVEQEKVSAEFKAGVLEIRLPKKEETKPKQVSIKVR